jgi:hypothetical protein
MKVHLFGLVAVISVLAGCADGTGAASVSVTLQVMRGPIAPVCGPDVTCDAPFAGSFDLYRLDRFRQRLRTGSDGRLDLLLAPGTYELIPADDTPILDPSSQRKEFEVTEPGPQTITLQFDTGIR